MKCSWQGQKHETPYACLLLARMTNTGRGIIPPRKCNINNSCGEFERLRTLTTSLGNTHLAHLLIVFAIWPRTLASWSSLISHSLQISFCKDFGERLEFLSDEYWISINPRLLSGCCFACYGNPFNNSMRSRENNERENHDGSSNWINRRTPIKWEPIFFHGSSGSTVE